MTKTKMTVLTKHQVKTERVDYMENGRPHAIVAEIRFDDECGNGHNSFTITASLYGPDRIPGESTVKSPAGKTPYCWGGGCCHEDIAKHFPHLADFIKWHLCSTDGPMHYTANALYWAGKAGYCNGQPNDPPNDAHLKSTIIYGALPEDSEVDPMTLARDGALVPWLEARLPKLLEAFQTAVESLGFTY